MSGNRALIVLPVFIIDGEMGTFIIQQGNNTGCPIHHYLVHVEYDGYCTVNMADQIFLESQQKYSTTEKRVKHFNNPFFERNG